MRRFGTQGPVRPERNYVVSRATELADFVMRVKEGTLYRYFRTAADRQDDFLPARFRRIRGRRTCVLSNSVEF